VKQACTAEHGTRKRNCEEQQDNPALDDLENLPVDDPVSRYLSEGDLSVSTPGKGRKRKSQGAVVHAQPLEDLDISQVRILRYLLLFFNPRHHHQHH
jgi:hypothetical protein